MAGHAPVTVAVGDDGRARVQEIDGEPTVGLAMDRATFLVLSGGRRKAEDGTIETTGDAALAGRIIDSMGSHPVTWTTDDIGDQSGRTALVTGPSLGGIGFHTALELARRGARVALAGRNADKLTAAADAVRAEVPDAELDHVLIDLADLTSVRERCREGARPGADPPPRQQRGHHGAAPAPQPGRPRVADGDQPLRAVPPHRPAPRPAGGVGRRTRRDGVLADAPRRAVGAAGRPAGRAALQPVAGLRPDQAGQPALHVRARPAPAPGRVCR